MTWTRQFWGSSSSETRNTGSSLELFGAGLSIHEMRSNLIKASSCQRDTLLKRWPNSDHFVALFQRCSKLVSTSYAAGPSILQCRSCQGCLGPFVPYWIFTFNGQCQFTLNIKKHRAKVQGANCQISSITIYKYSQPMWDYGNHPGKLCQHRETADVQEYHSGHHRGPDLL